jgi:hypothetical protein
MRIGWIPVLVVVALVDTGRMSLTTHFNYRGTETQTIFRGLPGRPLKIFRRGEAEIADSAGTLAKGKDRPWT